MNSKFEDYRPFIENDIPHTFSNPYTLKTFGVIDEVVITGEGEVNKRRIKVPKNPSKNRLALFNFDESTRAYLDKLILLLEENNLLLKIKPTYEDNDYYVFDDINPRIEALNNTPPNISGNGNAVMFIRTLRSLVNTNEEFINLYKSIVPFFGLNDTHSEEEPFKPFIMLTL